jgi:uncharacterized membrane protein
MAKRTREFRMSYLFLKWLHLAGASVLFGTGAGIAFFAWFGYRKSVREDDLGLLRGVLSLTVIADAVFTATAAALQPVTGLLLWRMTGGEWRNAWLMAVLALYVFVGLCWLPVVVMQIRLRDRTLAVQSIGELGDDFHARFRRWFLLGWPTFIGVMLLFALMILRGYFQSGAP